MFYNAFMTPYYFYAEPRQQNESAEPPSGILSTELSVQL